MKKKPLVSFYYEFSSFFKYILDQKGGSFKMDLKGIKNLEGKIDSDKLTWSGYIDLIFKSRNGLKRTEYSLKKLLGMSAMGGKKYIEYSQKINIRKVKNGIRIIFTFDIE